MTKNDARTIWFVAPGRIEIRSEELPDPEPGERRFFSRTQGLSPGTERLMFDGTFPRGLAADPEIDGFEGSFDYPFRYGYINVCEDSDGKRFFAFRDHTTAFNAAPEELIPLPDGIDDDLALLMPHTETALSILHDLNPRIGERVLIVGAGILGTLTALIASGYLGTDVTVVDPHPQKKLWFDGFGRGLSPIRFVAGTDPGADNFDAAVDCSGNPAGLQTAIDAVGMEGTVVAAGWFGDRKVPLDLGRAFHRRRIRLISSQVSHIGARLGSLWSKSRRMELVIEILEDIAPRHLITHRFSFSAAADAYTLIDTTEESFGLAALDTESGPPPD